MKDEIFIEARTGDFLELADELSAQTFSIALSKQQLASSVDRFVNFASQFIVTIIVFFNRGNVKARHSFIPIRFLFQKTTFALSHYPVSLRARLRANFVKLSFL